ncbi:ribosome-inactivating family protein [Streptomyces europaeiscabiei]|uniref:Ribosome-inactivating family protein n=1 Tax=Streptomyces europaeiscabiei TaxID=146819 RepID=A0AAJ2PSW4_9ACTN|nr:ribosome-inactivating family protein [Streptomyces europaeiscabiei]MDX3133069.1 ribosome-inactivating family protein [Streptomyces europaeiscabiei]
MPTSVVIVVALSVLLGFLVMVLPTGDAERSGSTADHATTNPETVASREHIDFPQVHWNISRGSGTYLSMLDQLRNLAETPAPGRHTPNADAEMNPAITDNTDNRRFANVVISSDSEIPTVHAVVRLSDFHVVRFFSDDTPSHGFALDLSPDVRKDDVTDDDWFVGKEGYSSLARVANQPLTAINLSASGLEDGLGNLGIRGTDRTTQARGMLRYLIAITEAARFHPIATCIAKGADNRSDVFLTEQQVSVMRN